jgi:hypothetical protein
MELLIVLQVVVQVEHLSICLLHCGAVDRSLFDNVHARQRIKMYLPLKGSCIAKHHCAAWRKPKRRIPSIIASKFPEYQQQSPMYRNHMRPYHFNIWIKKVNCFGLSPSLAKLIYDTRWKNWCLQDGVPTLLGINLIPSHHCLCLFGNVRSGKEHPLEFLDRRPILTRTRAFGGWQSWSHKRWNCTIEEALTWSVLHNGICVDWPDLVTIYSNYK